MSRTRTPEEIIAERALVLAEKTELDAKLTSCNQQISDAKRDAYQGQYSDPSWFRAVQYARTCTVREIREKAQRLSELKIELKEANKKRAATRTLPSEDKQIQTALWLVASLARELRQPDADEEMERRLDSALTMLDLLKPGWGA